MTRILIFLAFITVAISWSPVLYAQDFESFDREKWKEITRDIDYSPGEQEDEPEEERSSSPERSEGSGGTLFPFAGPVFKLLLITFFIVLLVIVVSKLMGRNILANKKVKSDGAVALDELEEKLMESDLMKWLQKAVGEKDYRLALRIYYLMIIKELSLKGLIIWKKEKTNLEYLYEMRGTSGYAGFEELTGIYHLVWYGEKNMDNDYLINASHKFKAFFQSLNSADNG